MVGSGGTGISGSSDIVATMRDSELGGVLLHEPVGEMDACLP